MRRAISFLGLVLLLACACGGPPSSPDGSQSSGTSDFPELTDDIIRERINDAWLREVPEESNSGSSIYWNFDRDEPKELTVVDKQMDGTSATVVLDIKTGSSPRSSRKLALAGQIRTHWQLQTGWVLRRWEIVETENISMKYKNLGKEEKNQNQNQTSDPPKPPSPNGR